MRSCAGLQGGEDGAAPASAPGARADAAAEAEGAIAAGGLEGLRLLTRGLTNRAIAEALVVSVRTVDAHASNVYAKLDVSGRAEAAAYAIRHGLA